MKRIVGVVSSVAMTLVCVVIATTSARAQQTASSGQDMQHNMMDMAMPAWQFTQDGVLYGVFNRQASPRGGREFTAPNWWMGMATRTGERQRFTFMAMLSLDPATVGRDGYRELFQVGEVLDGKPLIDRQHPHDFLMQLSASWRVAFGANSFTISGGPAAAPALGPAAFMHRASAAGLALAPIGHHTFDSTHVSFGVATAAFERGRMTIEGSVFNGREPDEDRWDLDLGRMDSVAGRVRFRPTPEWDVQLSTGRLKAPEALSPHDVTRTTTSASWQRAGSQRLTAITVGYGVNSAHGDRRAGAFGEFSVERPRYSLFGRMDSQALETGELLTGLPPDETSPDVPGTVTAFSLGATRRLFERGGLGGALGVRATTYAVPQILRATHGQHPWAAQIFFRVRLTSANAGHVH